MQGTFMAVIMSTFGKHLKSDWQNWRGCTLRSWGQLRGVGEICPL
jgi:hypothetical protein